jgi:S-disulfanyl-L-cysteine oxidoreductase SoxD
MSMRKATLAAAIVVLSAAMVNAAEPVKSPYLGTPMTAEDLAKWDLTIFPDGRGLPEGRGTAAEGRAVYDKHCASCHGMSGRGGTAEELVSAPQPLTDEGASKAIGPYWPYATTLFDFTRRSMPPQAPGSLTADEVYAVTAYLLAANKVIGEADEMTAKTLAKVKMPNRDGFVTIDAK